MQGALAALLSASITLERRATIGTMLLKISSWHRRARWFAAAAIVMMQSPGVLWPPEGHAEQLTGSTAVPRLRVGVDSNPKASSDYKRDSWRESIALMRGTPVSNFHFAKVWSEIERTPGVYDTAEFEFLLEQSKPLAVAFNLRVLDAGARNMADAYRQLPWDSQQMIDRVVAVVERLAPILGKRPWSYAIGNEIDMYFGARPQEIAPYARMLQRVKARVQALHPGVPFTTSFQASAAGQLRTLYEPIFATLDHVALTYYPLGAEFRVRPPQAATSDIPALVAAAAPLPVYFQEIGYPTSSLLGSSPEAQAEFVRLAFQAIRAIGTPRVLGATYLFQADLPQWLVDDIAREYGVSNSRNFREFVATLGLRDERDRPKPGWNAFVEQATAIGPNRQR
jgi:hypothetical protein